METRQILVAGKKCLEIRYHDWLIMKALEQEFRKKDRTTFLETWDDKLRLTVVMK